MRKITLFLVTLFITSLSFGQMSGTYKVGVSEVSPNFTTLKAACDAINAAGVSGDIVLEITSDLTEAANIGLGVNTNGHSIIIRPDQDVDRTITFTQTTDNSSPTGHIVIGYLGSGLTSAWSDANTIATSNVTIDGYAVGGSTRRLIINNTNASVTNARMIVVVGACANTVIKNCIINNLTTHTGSPFCVGAVVRKGTAIEVAPSNFTVDNNIMTATGNNVAMGMRITNSGTLTSGYPVVLTGLVIKNNTITARRRLIEINYTSGGDIYSNEFKTQQTGAPGTVSYGLWTSTGVTETINIYNNKFTQAYTEETGAYGHRVVSLASTATYNIYNNIFTGLDKTKVASGVALNLTYLFYSGVAGKIYNNTFYMPALTDATSTGYYNAIQLSGNTAEIKNNIFISDETTHANTAFISAIPTPATDYNNFYLRHAHTGSKIVSTYTTLGDYQTANPTKDINSKSKDVFFVSATDLSITGTSVNDPDLAAPLLATVLTDIFGTARHTPNVYMGAHEASDLNAPAPTKIFTVTAPQGTEHVYITGSFTGKFWDYTTPYELTPTASPYEFTGTFACADGVEYKYLCNPGNLEYQEATSVNPLTVADNHTYNAADVVTYWKAVPKLKLNVSINGAIPTNLYVKGSWDSWATPVALTASSTPLTVPAQRIKSATNAVSYTGTIGDGSTSVIYSNTEYKYYTTDLADPNWEVNTDGSARDNRWAIYPLMSDEIARFVSQISTGLGAVKDIDVRIMRTATGITATFDGTVDIELYSINGRLIEKTKANGSYSRNLEHGTYIIRINGKATKFVK